MGNGLLKFMKNIIKRGLASEAKIVINQFKVYVP